MLIRVFRHNLIRLQENIMQMRDIQRKTVRENYTNYEENLKEMYKLLQRSKCILKLLDRYINRYGMYKYQDEEFMDDYSYINTIYMNAYIMGLYDGWIQQTIYLQRFEAILERGTLYESGRN